VRGEEPSEDKALLVSLDGRPIGLLQRSLIHDYPEDLAEFAAVVGRSRGRRPAREEGSGRSRHRGAMKVRAPEGTHPPNAVAKTA
jgi:hypothetical protein